MMKIPRPGRFIVTGSQNILLMRSVSQTLAGRTALLLLHPLSLAELYGLPPLDPRALDRGSTALPTHAIVRLSATDPWETLVTGFYPPVHDRQLSAREWMGDYLRTYVERDLREVTQVLDLRAFETFVRLAAGRTAAELSLGGLASDAGITHQTARRWLTALEIGYVATTLPSHHANYRRRLRIEVKSGRTVPPDAVAGLKWWTGIPSNPNRGGVLVHGGTASFDLSGFRVLPWFLAAGANL